VRLFVIWLKRNGAGGELHVANPQPTNQTIPLADLERIEILHSLLANTALDPVPTTPTTSCYTRQHLDSRPTLKQIAVIAPAGPGALGVALTLGIAQRASVGRRRLGLAARRL
jgi:hypothetical protein